MFTANVALDVGVFICFGCGRLVGSVSYIGFSCHLINAHSARSIGCWRICFGNFNAQGVCNVIG